MSCAGPPALEAENLLQVAQASVQLETYREFARPEAETIAKLPSFDPSVSDIDDCVKQKDKATASTALLWACSVAIPLATKTTC